MAETKWYVLRAVSGQEKKVKAYLDNEVARQKVEDFVPQILIPSEKVYEVRNGKKRVRDKSFFPGYIIVEADLSHGEVSHMITSMPGVIGFLSANTGGTSKTPIPLRLSEINRILGKVDEGAQDEVIQSVNFIKGETIKVMDGPFSGFEGSVEEIFDERKKLNVMVKIFGRNTPVELNYSQVEKQ
jgi:transcription termination/antitermination protein NusG